MAVSGDEPALEDLTARRLRAPPVVTKLLPLINS